MKTQIHGTQCDWDEVRQMTDQPIITIITSTFNAGKDLPWTIASIKKQTYPYVQWIVADGASSDDTVELLQENSDMIDVWFSEPDEGIYNAWNKALAYAQGDWVQFIGAGDELYEADTLAKVAEHLKTAHPKYDFVYGQVMHISEKGRQKLYVSGEPWENYVGRWECGRIRLPEHPAVFHHSSLFNDNPAFDLRFKIAADSYFLMKKINGDLLYLPVIVDVMPRGGVSGTVSGGLSFYHEIEVMMKELSLSPPISHNVVIKIKYYFTATLLKIISEKQYGQFIDFTKKIRGKPKVFTVE